MSEINNNNNGTTDNYQRKLETRGTGIGDKIHPSPVSTNYMFNTPYPFRDLRQPDVPLKPMDFSFQNGIGFPTRLRSQQLPPSIHILESSVHKMTEVTHTSTLPLQPVSLPSTTPSLYKSEPQLHPNPGQDHSEPHGLSREETTVLLPLSSNLGNTSVNPSPTLPPSLTSFPNRTFIFRNSATEPRGFLSNYFLRNQSAKRQPPLSPSLQQLSSLGKSPNTANDSSSKFQLSSPSLTSLNSQSTRSIEAATSNNTSSLSSSNASSRLTTPLIEEFLNKRKPDLMTPLQPIPSSVTTFGSAGDFFEAERRRMPVTGTMTGTVYQRISSRGAALLYSPPSSKTPAAFSETSTASTPKQKASEDKDNTTTGGFSSREELRRQIQKDVEERKKTLAKETVPTVEKVTMNGASVGNGRELSTKPPKSVPEPPFMSKKTLPGRDTKGHTLEDGEHSSDSGVGTGGPASVESSEEGGGGGRKSCCEVDFDLLRRNVDHLSSACSSTLHSSEDEDSESDEEEEDDDDEPEREKVDIEEEETALQVSSQSSRATSRDRNRSVSRQRSSQVSSSSGRQSRLRPSSAESVSTATATTTTTTTTSSTSTTKSTSTTASSSTTSLVQTAAPPRAKVRPISAKPSASRRAPTTADLLAPMVPDSPLKEFLDSLTKEKPGGIKAPLVPSLFPRVAPTVRFITENEKMESLPWQFRKLLKWRMSMITPLIVRQTVLRSGFRMSSQCSTVSDLETHVTTDWIGYFGRHCKAPVFNTIREYQKVNHFPGSFHLGRKDRLWRNLSRMQAKHGRKEFGFFPQTFCLPGEVQELKEVFDTEPSGKQKWIVKPVFDTEPSGKQKWIVKPPASARGIGIRVVHKWSQIPKQKNVIVQRYISNPYLINGSKFDLRIYVYVTSFNPLRAYVYKEGLVRFASVQYSTSVNSLHNRFIHLTNYSINKQNAANYVENEGDGRATPGCHKWSLSELWNYFESHGVKSSHIQDNIHDLVVKTLLAGESHIASNVEENCRGSQCVHELFGFDVLLDADLKPWILECNISPSLHSDSKLDVKIKGSLMRDVFNLAGFVLPRPTDVLVDSGASEASGDGNNNNATDVNLKEKLKTVTQDPKFHWESPLTDAERKKQNFYVAQATEQFSSQQENSRNSRRLSADRSMLDSLNRADVRCLVTTIDELHRVGDFVRVFPPKDSEMYAHYMSLCDEPLKYYNLLLWAYHSYYLGKNTLKGVQMLQILCKKGQHLAHRSQIASSSSKKDN